MSARPRRRLTTVALAGGLALVAVTSGCAAWRIHQSAELARQSQPFEQRPAEPRLRLLIVGDSTAVGAGASSAQNSIAGLLGRAHPALWIENRARNGARFADVQVQLAQDEQRFDIVLVQAGGNDVIRLTAQRDLDAAIDGVARQARLRAPLVLLMPAGNVGNSPFFFAPLSWWMTQRSRSLHGLVQQSAERYGAVYVDLFKERADDPFVHDRSLNAADGLHPSDTGYRLWLRQLLAQTALAQRLEGV
jgi:lysophospholipase L1-like esterase